MVNIIKTAKLIIFFGMLLPTIAFAAYPPSPVDGQLWREDGVPRVYVAATNKWIIIDSDRYENVIRYGAICDSTTDNTAALQAAETAAETSGKVVFLPSCTVGQTYIVDSSVSFDVPVIANGGAIIENDSSATLTFNKGFIALKDSQVFVTGGGNIVISVPQTTYPEWWGYSTSDGAINRIAIQSAINSLTTGKVVLSKEYLIAHDGTLDNTIFPIIRLKNGVDLEGISRESAILKIPDAHGQYLAMLGNQISQNPSVNVENVKISNITFDHNYTNNTANSIDSVAYFSHTRASVYIYGGYNVVFDNNRVTDSDSIVCVYYTGDATGRVDKNFNTGVVSNSQFDDIGDIGAHYDHSTLNLQGGNIKAIHNNVISSFTAQNAGSAIEVHANNTIVSENTLIGSYSGVTLTGINAYGDDIDIVISNNNITSRIAAIALFSQQKNDHTTGYGLNGVTIENNTFFVDYDSGFIPTDQFRAAACITDSPSLDNLPMRNFIINNNVCDFAIETKSADAWILLSNTAGFSFAGGPTTAPRENFKITNNIITDSPMAGIVFNTVATKHVDINNNVIKNWASAQFSSTAAQYKTAIKAVSIYNAGDFLVTNNKFIEDRATSLISYEYYISESDTTTDGLMKFVDNILEVYDPVHATFVGNFNDPADDTILPYVKERGNLIILPLIDFRAGSEMYDLSTNTRNYLGEDGKIWDSITYSLNTMSYLGDMSIESLGVLTFASSQVIMTPTTALLPPSVAADPCGTFPAGTHFYNSTAGIPCYCNNANADLKTSDDTDCFP